MLISHHGTPWSVNSRFWKVRRNKKCHDQAHDLKCGELARETDSKNDLQSLCIAMYRPCTNFRTVIFTNMDLMLKLLSTWRVAMSHWNPLSQGRYLGEWWRPNHRPHSTYICLFVYSFFLMHIHVVNVGKATLKMDSMCVGETFVNPDNNIYNVLHWYWQCTQSSTRNSGKNGCAEHYRNTFINVYG